jgi:hypothetical protein
MRHLQSLIALCIVFSTALTAMAGPGDTIKVQTFTFGSVQDAWFEMPSLDIEVEKILMKYTLKCNPAQVPACGEWDYLTYTYLYDHTGVLDSNLLTHANYEVNGESFPTYAYSSSPTYVYTASWLYNTVYDDTLSYNAYQIGEGTASVDFPLDAAQPAGRAQFIWTAEELTDAGLVAGNITGLQVHLLEVGSVLENLHIRMAPTAATESGLQFESPFWTEVYNSDVVPMLSTWASVPFTTPFVWDGVSNIVVEVTFQNPAAGESTWLEATDIGVNRSLFTRGGDRYLDVWNPVYAAVDGTPFAALDGQLTVSWWSYGDPEFQPQSGTTFEIRDAAANRVVNVHGPWGDGVIYWDAGNSGGGSYDRISKAAPAADYEGNWTHWAFTKDAEAGTMKIYKNGVEWHTGSGFTRTMEDGTIMRIGKGLWGGSQSYFGHIDEFAMWDAILDPATIQDYMYKDLDDAHPNADDLFLYYHFDDGGSIYESDASASGADLGMIGTVSRMYDAAQLFRNTQQSTLRPNVIWEQGEFVSHLDSVLVIDSVMNDPLTMVLFDPENPTVGIDTFQVWPGDYYTYVFNEEGIIVDSTYISNTDDIVQEFYEYYGPAYEVIDRYELARYITPYGIGLDLGDGFTWTFDVSDYRPLLHDSVRIAAGNWQELLDMELWFIEGTPPREVMEVQNLWTGYKGYNTDEAFDANTPPIDVTLSSLAKTFRIKSRVTGHGFGGTANCAEFCAKEHYFKIDGDVVWTQEVWRDDCDVNPVYPQGGTWVYDRANWCPGAEVGTYDFDITDEVVPGNTYTFDYAAEDYFWNGGGSFPYYQTEVQLISYGAFNFNLDAAVIDIIAPSSDQMWGRKNPICSNPIIRIQNTGAQTLTSLYIEFGLEGADKSAYNWSGELAPMEWEEVMLPDYEWDESSTFTVTISQPNGGADEYAANNTMQSSVAIPELLPADLILEFKTNTKPNENDVFIYNSNGEEVFARTSFTASTVHKDTISLPDGCYELFVWDYDEDGIAWWANSDGTGYFRVKNASTGSIIKNYEPDFGGLIYQQFRVGTYVDAEDFVPVANTLEVFPNPAKDMVYLQVELNGRKDTRLYIFDHAGQLVHEEAPGRIQQQTLHLDVSQYASGMYFAVLMADNERLRIPFVVDR